MQINVSFVPLFLCFFFLLKIKTCLLLFIVLDVENFTTFGVKLLKLGKLPFNFEKVPVKGERVREKIVC